MAFTGKWMELETTMLSGISQKNQRPGILSDMWMLTQNKEGRGMWRSS